MKIISVIVIGAGMRGKTYTHYMKNMPEKFKVVGVAEPIDARRNYMKEVHEISDDMCFNSWEEILAKPKMADMAIISTMDEMHYEPAMKAIELGYDLLLEKPVAPTAEECADIALAAEKKGVKVLVCHVLRYAAFFKRVKQLVMDGVIGEIMSIMHVEGVGNVHQSHSYVRGNWHCEEKTSNMLLAKCCHDVDILQWLIDKPCKKVQSFGKLSYFTPANAPQGAPVRCADGGCPVADTCPYNCMKLYYDDKDNDWFRGAATKGMTEGAVPTDEEVMAALKTTDYGLCVFHANNNVVDHQVVNMEFADGINATLNMNAFNRGGRYIRIFGTKGELYAAAEDDRINVYTFEDKNTVQVPVVKVGESILAGHGGGDGAMIEDLYDYLIGNYKGVSIGNIDVSVKNHLIVFAAEKARHNNTVEEVDKYFSDLGFSINY